MLTDCGGEDCWECHAPDTPILHHIRTLSVIFATGCPVGINGLGITVMGVRAARYCADLL